MVWCGTADSRQSKSELLSNATRRVLPWRPSAPRWAWPSTQFGLRCFGMAWW